MGLFTNQFANVVEWEEWREDMIFWKWTNREIKKGSKLIIKPGQDAIFLYNGKVEGIFKDDGEYDIESRDHSIPFNIKGIQVWIQFRYACRSSFCEYKGICC